jgi:predicted ribosomally synthesized peptide with SipW-like signal peptide
MQKSILVSLVTIGLLASVIGVGTYAFFSDTETSTGNTMTAGTLDLSFNSVENVPFSITDMKPSYHKESGWVRLIFQENPGKLYKKILPATCTPAASNDARDKECHAKAAQICGPDPAPSCLTTEYTACINQKMTDQMWFDLKIWKDGANVTLIPDETKNLANVVGKWIYLGEFQPSVEIPVVESFHLQTGVTNWAQGQTCTFDEQYLLEQDNAPMQPGCENRVPGTVCVPT